MSLVAVGNDLDMRATADSIQRSSVAIDAVSVQPFKIPTPSPESDGTLKWDSTTMVYVEVRAGGETGMGYTYADAAAARLIEDLLAGVLVGKDALQTGARYAQLYAAIRNNGREGVASMAVSALDIALWDLKGKLLNVPVCVLLGNVRAEVPVYGSGGFTSYDRTKLADEMSYFLGDLGIPRGTPASPASTAPFSR